MPYNSWPLEKKWGTPEGFIRLTRLHVYAIDKGENRIFFSLD